MASWFFLTDSNRATFVSAKRVIFIFERRMAVQLAGVLYQLRCKHFVLCVQAMFVLTGLSHRRGEKLMVDFQTVYP